MSKKKNKVNSGDIGNYSAVSEQFTRLKCILVRDIILETSMQSLAQFKKASDLKTKDNFSFQDRYKKNVLNNFKG